VAGWEAHTHTHTHTHTHVIQPMCPARRTPGVGGGGMAEAFSDLSSPDVGVMVLKVCSDILTPFPSPYNTVLSLRPSELR
jgi:hypothetical protein